MSPFRLLILAALGYILYRLLTAGGRTPTKQQSGQGLSGGHDVDDVLVEDPVCHTYIPRQGAEALTVGQSTHYFCSTECRQKYQELS